MMRVFVISVNVLLLLTTVSCHDGLLAGEFSKAILDEMTTIQAHFLTNLKPDCQKLQELHFEYLLYKRDNRDTPLNLDPTSPKDIDPDKQIILLIHGWLQSSNSSGIIQLKDAYLDRYDCNVVVLDWSQIAMQAYTTGYCHMQRMGAQVSRFLCHTSTELNVPLGEVHIVGYSLGGQLAGVSANYVKSKCKKQIGRITGLDPAGPIFQNLPERRRLDKSDAKFVDIIHTDQMKFGFSGNTGHSDFYPNCGQIQPGCTSVKNIKDDSSIAEIMCSHHRSVDYMVESIQSDNFIGVTCGMCPRYCRPNIMNEIYTIMGEGASPQGHSNNKFYLATRNIQPYGQGWTLYSAKLP